MMIIYSRDIWRLPMTTQQAAAAHHAAHLAGVTADSSRSKGGEQGWNKGGEQGRREGGERVM